VALTTLATPWFRENFGKIAAIDKMNPHPAGKMREHTGAVLWKMMITT
jgi:hypothetical protein